MRQLKITQQITKRESVSLTKYLNDVSAIKLLTPEQEVEVSIKAANGDEEAKRLLVESNLRFVISVAKQYQNQAALDELIQAGNMGLMNAASKFDPSRGFKFISYAVWWIRQSILQYVAENSRMVRIPLNKIGATNKLKTVTSHLEQELNRSPSPNEILDRLNEINDSNIEISHLEDLFAINQSTTSLDAPVTNEPDTTATLMDYIPANEQTEDIGYILQSQDLIVMLQQIMTKKLTSRERDVVAFYFGLFGNQPQTLEEIGIKLDLTRERVRQIKEKAIRRLKHSNASKLVKEYL